jgi:cyclopropane fatty-acyl-phospholipid synthase-like methyltransferase
VGIAAYFAEKGFDVVGVDVSTNMIEIAKREIPGGQFFVSDMVDCDFSPHEFNLIISLFAIVHVPQARQRLLFEKVHNWLKPNGVSYLTLGYQEEKELIKDDWHGVKMAWSMFSQEHYQELLSEVGFDLIWDEVEELPNGETFYNVIVLRK